LDNTPETNEKIAEESAIKEKDNLKLKDNPNEKDDIKKDALKIEKKPIEKDKKMDSNKIKTPAKKPESKTKEKQEKDDFRYIVRIANTDIDGEKTIERGLTSIKGIGMHMSTLVIDSSGLDRNLKMGNLTDKQIEKIKDSLDKILKTAPSWMLNHRKDSEIGKDIHYIGSEIELKLRDEINIMKKIRSYKGIRHERGLTVRGQRTRANNRKGLTLGVSKKGVQKK
jgi:small subunit ribosomal protein S13